MVVRGGVERIIIIILDFNFLIEFPMIVCGVVGGKKSLFGRNRNDPFVAALTHIQKRKSTTIIKKKFKNRFSSNSSH